MLFGWRKRNEGFEWREYVRTTILVRRADRQKRLDDARLAALSNVKDVKERAVNAGIAKVEGVRDGAAAAGQRAGHAVAQAAMAGAAKAAGGAKLAAVAVAQAAKAIPRPAAPAVLKRSAGDLAMYAADAPRRWRLMKPYLLPAAGIGAAVFVFGAALSPQTPGSVSTIPAQANATGVPALTTGSIAASDNVVSGRANVTAGDQLRLNGKSIRLAGIEAPAAAQTCLKSSGRRWECAASARSALRKLVRGKTVSCELKDAGENGTDQLAHCRASGEDLSAALVRGGHAFATDDGPYAGEEEAARAGKLGIWQGQSDRPKEWRTKMWEEAKRSAPQGCPIKGLVRSEGRYYAMPWSQGYGTRALRTGKGERWFCSEDEARAAGFKEPSRL